MSLIVEEIGEKNRTEANRYLAAHEETSQFLINNMREHGPRLAQHPNSGNFRLIRDGEDVTAVFCLARRGNLIVQADSDYSQVVLRFCKADPVKLKGFIGEWESVAPIWKRFKTENPHYKPIYESKEIVYTYELREDDKNLKHDPRVRFLSRSDFRQWLQHSYHYMKELSVPDDLTDGQKQSIFEQQARDKHWWGLFDGEELLSRTALNSKGESIGQVGGVFTPWQYRKRGYAKATMFHMLKDCCNLHRHRKNILFTGQTNIPAQKLYESMGYRRIGSFAVILG